jgi:DeoR family transcriptional regulator of aga operon
MIRHSDQVIIVADSSKFGVIAMNRVCPVSDIHTIVVVGSLPEKEAQRYRDKGLRVCFAR